MPAGLHERQEEIALVGDALAALASGRGSIGKTTVIGRAREDARARGVAVAAARGSELERAFAWGVVRQLLEPRLRGMPGDARGRALAGAAALAAPVVLPDGASLPGDADPSFGVLHGLYWLVAALAAERPQLLIVD